MRSIHPSARTTPAVRAELARSTESSGMPAARYGVSTETVRKWRRRGPDDCADRSSRPKRLPWKATEAEHLAVKDDDTERSALAFLDEAAAALPFRTRYLLTDRGSCFTADAFEARRLMLGIEHRKTRPYSPQTNGMVERFNGRVGQEVLTITVGGHRDLEHLLRGYSQAYNGRRQRVLRGRAPADVVRRRLRTKPDLANPQQRSPGPAVMPNGMRAVATAKDPSQPDS